MADTYNEDDELSRVLEWLKANGLALVAGVVLGLIIIVGWKWWGAHVESRAQAAAQLYGSSVQEIASGDTSEEALARVEQLKQEYQGSPYAANAVFRLAAQAVKQEQYDKALVQLDWIINNTDSVPTRSLARLRKARVLWADGQTDAALKLLETKHPKSFDRVYAELVGDIHMSLGEQADAHAAYQRAAGAAVAAGGILQRKLAQTASSDASSSASAAQAAETANEGA